MKKTIFLFITLACFSNATAQVPMGDSIRAVYIPDMCILSKQFLTLHQNQYPTNFTARSLLVRIKKAGYNCIAAYAPSITWDYNPKISNANFYPFAKTSSGGELLFVKEAFEMCQDNGLTLIPMICMSNRHSGDSWNFPTTPPDKIELSSHTVNIDVTNDHLGTITAQSEDVPDNGRDKAFDNRTSTKWRDSSKTSWIQYAFTGNTKYTVVQYTITSANDAQECDPADWQLLGSNDGSNWATLDSKTGQVFSARLLKKTFSFSNTATYAMYKLAITKVHNPTTAKAIQLSEIEFIRQVLYTASPLGPDKSGVKGMDWYFDSLLCRIQREFALSKNYKAGDYIPYIHLSHDEMHTWEDSCLLINSPRDKAWVLSHGNNAMAFKRLISNELIRRVDEIRTRIDSRTQVMMFADMWDPELNGRLPLKTFKSGVMVRLAPMAPSPGDTSIADLPGLTVAQRYIVKKRLILCPWYYRTRGLNGGDYDNNNTFNYFTQGTRQFRILPWNAYDMTVLAESHLQIRRQAALGRVYRKFIVGYNAAEFPCWQEMTCPGVNCPCGSSSGLQNVNYWDWTKNMYDQVGDYDVIEFLAKSHAQVVDVSPATNDSL